MLRRKCYRLKNYSLCHSVTWLDPNGVISFNLFLLIETHFRMSLWNQNASLKIAFVIHHSFLLVSKRKQFSMILKVLCWCCMKFRQQMGWFKLLIQNWWYYNMCLGLKEVKLLNNRFIHLMLTRHNWSRYWSNTLKSNIFFLLITNFRDCE
jgi:hypothetical protein